MQQEQGGSEEIMKQNQDRRLKPMEGENQQQPQPQQQPQKCPRCDSLNTKFCYYNNYSLSQPRYFCKTCRRYWTQGGTLRNVPVGGGCRKGKRAKTSSTSSSFSENSRSQSQPHPQSMASSQSLNIMSTTNSGNTVSPALRTKESSGDLVLPPGISSMGPYYSGGGFLTSLAAIQSLHDQPQSFALNQPVNLGGDLGSGPSNLTLLHGFNAFGSQQLQQQIQQQRQIYHMSNRENKSGDHPFYASSSQQQNWHQGFGSTTTNPTVSDTALWSISTSTTTGNTNSNSTTTAGSFPLNPPDHEWHDLPGYGPPP
ncbi:hypothetical protein P3X46_020301 [Hevea brasiliensis]|uniref:Dof zinc finger protein n=2 Tax=Hevea brasiliensis TaxID=3981 RepID=A0A6A6LPF2_HEVBR|nr:dof zinc finger protein PBF [Hevea brasiliensis]KAF2303310.1 hypothetical protein GH714_016544 [Hevea brasiliensis]KAJ9168817.1 hypothetical protein P3X46_020301 [Hevea brasiliensis]